MTLDHWLSIFQKPIDLVGVVLYVLIFPVYHTLYPALMRAFPTRAAKSRLDIYRRSWIAGLIERQDVVAAAQQTRNLTMVNSLLASSSLILMGLTANLLVRPTLIATELTGLKGSEASEEALTAKLFLLIVVFGVAFGYCMTSLRHLGHFSLVVGADPALLDRYEGSAVDYLSALINRASNRYTLAVRCLFSASPIFLWLFDPLFFVLMTAFWGAKFTLAQDFSWPGSRRSPLPDGSPRELELAVLDDPDDESAPASEGSIDDTDVEAPRERTGS